MKPINAPQDVFKKVHMSEKKMIFREIAYEKIQLLVKGENEDFVHLAAFRVEKDERLYCAPAPASSLLTSEQPVVVNFLFKEESYFFHTQLSFDQGIPWVDISKDLFQLQRRKNARLDLPDDYPGMVNIVDVNGKSCFVEAKIKDISAGGLKILMPQSEPAIKMNDKINLVLRLGHRRPQNLLTEVRFVASLAGGQVFGVQFQNRDNVMENKLLVMMMDLQREIYMKYGPT
jgi:c-di-GMP-binding flagellar brake protein YcgR